MGRGSGLRSRGRMRPRLFNFDGACKRETFGIVNKFRWIGMAFIDGDWLGGCERLALHLISFSVLTRLLGYLRV